MAHDNAPEHELRPQDSTEFRDLLRTARALTLSEPEARAKAQEEWDRIRRERGNLR